MNVIADVGYNMPKKEKDPVVEDSSLEENNSDSLVEPEIPVVEEPIATSNKKKVSINPLDYIDTKILKSTIQTLNKQLKVEKFTFGDDPRLQAYIMPSGSISLNKKMGGGLQRRKIHLFYGAKSSGKSFLDYKNVCTLQRICRNCLGVLPFEDYFTEQIRKYYGFNDCSCGKPEMHRVLRIDYESDYAFSPNPENTETHKKKLAHMEKLGVIGGAYTIGFASSLEECTDILKSVIPSLEYDYITVDSLQGSQTDYVYDKEGHDETMGIDPRKLNIVLRNIMNSFHKAGIDNYRWLPAIVLISQVRMSIGRTMSFADFSGGKGLEHQNSFILKQAHSDYLGKDGQAYTSSGKEDIYGLRINYENKKFKMGSSEDVEAYFTGSFDIFIRDTGFGYKYGDFNYIREIIDIGVGSGKIKQRGAYYDIDGQTYQGKDKLQAAIIEDKLLLKKIL